MKEFIQKFSSLDLLLFLISKVRKIFQPQVYIINVLSMALENSSMIGILGREGMGKSTAIAKFVYDSKDVYYVRIGQSYGVKNFIDEMIYQLSGEYPVQQQLFLKVKELSSLLVKSNSKKLIIVDDAGKLTPRGLGFFHELRENSIHCAGFAFVGLPYFKEALIRARDRGVPGVAEFYRRVQSWHEIPGLQDTDALVFGKECRLSDQQIELLKLMVQHGEVVTLSEIEIACTKILSLSELDVKDLIADYMDLSRSSKRNPSGSDRKPVKRSRPIRKQKPNFDTESEFEDI